MDSLVQDFSTIEPQRAERAGGKAGRLALMARAGYPVPPGWIVWPEAFRRERLIERARQAIGALIATYRDSHPTATFAVRSSGRDEDSAGAAFAGVFQTILNVGDPAAVVEAVERVYASRHRAADYRRARGMDERQEMAVIVQVFIPAECAGVCLTVDPVAQRGDRLVINAAWGLGAGVMDGKIPTDTYWLERPALVQMERHIAHKMFQMAPSADGVEKVAVGPELQRTACLPPAWLTRVARFALALARHFGRPQEVEWAIGEGQIWIMQSRPQTALPPDLADPAPFPVTWQADGARDFWQLMEYSRVASPPLPLEHDTQRVRESIREMTCRAMGIDRNMEMRVWNGRGYSRRIPLEISDGDRRVRQAAARDLRRRLKAEGRTTWDHWGPEIVTAVEQLRNFDPEDGDGMALARHLEDALAVVRRHASLHPRLIFKPHDSYFAAFERVSGMSGDAAHEAAYRLVDVEENVLSHLIDALYELAVAARGHPALLELIRDPADDVVERLGALPEAKSFREQFHKFMSRYGERIGDGYGSEMGITTPTWLEDPARPLRRIAQFLASDVSDPGIARVAARRARDAQVQALCDGCLDPGTVAEFRAELAYARRSMKVLEEHNHWIDQATGGRLRLAVMAAAGWLAARDLLAEPGEIFFLTYAEILDGLRSGALPAGLVATRRRQQAQWATLTPPLFLGLPGPALPERPPVAEIAADGGEPGDGDVLHGIGASPGIVRGPACIWPQAAVEIQVQPGDILVATNAGPLWTPLFPILAGIVLEEGSLGQHAAAIAREYGIPAVVGVSGATRRLSDGEVVQVDGAAGVIEWVDAGDRE